MGSDGKEGAVSLGIQRDGISRTVLEMVRDSSEPMAIREIAGPLAGGGGKDLDGPAVALVVARVRNAVPRLPGRLDGDLTGRATYWSIKHRET
jgi:hypothetical protein